jgi:hypothetical protein
LHDSYIGVEGQNRAIGDEINSGQASLFQRESRRIEVCFINLICFLRQLHTQRGDRMMDERGVVPVLSISFSPSRKYSLFIDFQGWKFVPEILNMS